MSLQVPTAAISATSAPREREASTYSVRHAGWSGTCYAVYQVNVSSNYQNTLKYMVKSLAWDDKCNNVISWE